jgi:epoxyqueuosine reductase QueG
MATEIKNAEKAVSHPLEETFNIQEHTTLVPYKEVTSTLVVHEPYDNKDNEIEQQLQDLYDMSIEAYENQLDESDVVEGKYKARNGEVAVQFLRMALDSVREKSLLKQHKDGIEVSKKTPATNPNGMIVDRNTLLRALKERSTIDQTGQPVTDAQFEDSK